MTRLLSLAFLPIIALAMLFLLTQSAIAWLRGDREAFRCVRVLKRGVCL